MSELREFAAIVDRPERAGAAKPPSEEELRTALQALLHHQAIYPTTWGVGRSFDILVAHLEFARKYFDALGARVEHSARDQMVALVPNGADKIYGWQSMRLRQDETFVLMALAYIREAAIKDREIIEDGKVASTTDDIVDVIRRLTGKEPPNEARLNEILSLCRRKGLVQLGEHDKQERLRELWILPAVEILVPSSWVSRIVVHYGGEPEPKNDADSSPSDAQPAEAADEQGKHDHA